MFPSIPGSKLLRKILWGLSKNAWEMFPKRGGAPVIIHWLWWDFPFIHHPAMGVSHWFNFSFNGFLIFHYHPALRGFPEWSCNQAHPRGAIRWPWLSWLVSSRHGDDWGSSIYIKNPPANSSWYANHEATSVNLNQHVLDSCSLVPSQPLSKSIGQTPTPRDGGQHQMDTMFINI